MLTLVASLNGLGGGGGGGVGLLPYAGHIGICGAKRCHFSALLVVNRVSILADFGHK